MERILICPLNWGMGHATRVMHLAGALHDRGHYVVIAGSPSLLSLYDDSVCSKRVPFTTMRVHYSRVLPAWLAILLQGPVVLLQYFIDRFKVSGLIRRESITLLVSDNRFGAFSRRVYSVYISHQLTIRIKRDRGPAGRLLSSLHRAMAARYNETWVPDVDGLLTGRLSEGGGRAGRVRYTGILSMLAVVEERVPQPPPPKGFCAVLISGPEPQRSLLEKRLTAILASSKGSYAIAGGRLNPSAGTAATSNMLIYQRAAPGEIKYLINHASSVICRAGYSTMMDLVYAGKSAVVIPTPGQTEQEYLAEYLHMKGMFVHVPQNRAELVTTADTSGCTIDGSLKNRSEELLEQAVESLLRRSSSR